MAVILSPEMQTGLVLGLAGGVLRVVVGMLKVVSARYKFYWSMTLVALVAGGFIGACLGLVFYFHPAAALLAGFGGLDVLQSVYRAFHAQKVIVVPNGGKS